MSKALAAPVVALAALGTPCDALVLPSPTNIYSNAIAAVRYTLGPSMSLTDALTSSSQSLIGEAEAAKGGIAKLDAPTWHKAADMLDECITEASGMSGLWEQTALSLQEAAADAREIAFAISGVATPEILQTDEQAAKAAWLSKLDTPAFGKAASALSEVVAVATKIHDLASQCDKGDQVACTNLSNEDKAKAAWLSKCDVPNWGAAAQATSHIVEVAAMSPNQDAAKAAWLSKLDAPTWGKAASALTSVVAEAAQMADLSAKCDSGDKVACVHLTNEDEAKRAWLSKLDVPTWGQVASTVSEAAAAATITQVKDDEAAKAAWLSKLDEPSWVSPGAGGLTDPSWGVGKVVPTEPVSSPVGFVTPSDEAAAKAAWLSKLDLPTTPNNEASAKRAWLSKLDQPTWGAAASALYEAASIADLSAQCDEGVQTACSQVSGEDAAKAAWLSKLDVPSWGAAAQVVNDILEVTNLNPSEDAAKAAWLAKLDAPTWGQAASALTEVVAEAAQMADLTAKCESGEQKACTNLSNEDKAKREWLSKLDVPAWGQVAATVSSGAVAVAGEVDAKAAWLSKIEDNTPAWLSKIGRSSTVGKVVPTGRDSAAVKESLFLARQKSELAITELDTMVRIIKDIKTLVEN